MSSKRSFPVHHNGSGDARHYATSGPVTTAPCSELSCSLLTKVDVAQALPLIPSSPRTPTDLTWGNADQHPATRHNRLLGIRAPTGDRRQRLARDQRRHSSSSFPLRLDQGARDVDARDYSPTAGRVVAHNTCSTVEMPHNA